MFRFTIRDVLWLMVVVGLIAGWGVDHWRHATALRELRLRELFAELRADMTMDSGMSIDGAGDVSRNPTPIHGVVLRVTEDSCELSVGSDDAVLVGTEFSVTRNGTRLG